MFRKSYTFDDVLAVPRESSVKSRSHVSLDVELSKGINVKNPFIPANMKTIVNESVLDIMAQNGSMSIMHRFDTEEEQLKVAKWVVEKEYQNLIGMSVGVKDHDYQMVDKFVDAGIKIICVDVAHGHSTMCMDMCRWISKKYPDVFLIAGNVATGDGARDLWLAGVDAVKVGIGEGSNCRTRIETGCGNPQLSAIMEAAEEKRKLQNTYEIVNNDRQLFLISDGGLTNAGNCAKALAFADLVMAGNLFAATDEGPGDIIDLGKKYKRYDGSSTLKDKHVEGAKALIECKGPLQGVLDRLCQGVRSSLSYQGVYNLVDFKKVVEFVELSTIAQKTNDAHNLKVIE